MVIVILNGSILIVAIIAAALVGAMTNVGAAWLLTEYRDPEAQMIASCRRVLLGTLREIG